MKRFVLGMAALALLLVTTETANAQYWRVSGGYGWGSPYYGVSYGTRVGDSGFLSVGLSSGYGGYYGYPAYGYSYAPVYYSRPVYYSTPAYYSTPVYYSTPYYYSSPTIGVSYYSGPRWRYGWGW